MDFYDDFSSEDELELQLNNENRANDEPQWGGHQNDVHGILQQRPRRRQLPAVPSPPLSLDWLNLTSYGFPESVALSELPGSKFRGHYRDLPTDINTLKSLDISDIVVLLTMAEFRKFRVPTLLSEYEAAGFLVFHFPIEDGMIPDDIVGMNNLLDKIRKRVADGHRVLVHCYGGLGRAVLIGACLLQVIDQDISPDEVIVQLRELRGPRAVQSVKQYNFISEYRELCYKAQNSSAEEDGHVSR